LVTCERVIELLGGYVAGGLPATSRVEVARHLSVCVECTALSAVYREVIRLAGSLPLPTLSEAAASRLLSGVQSATAHPGCGAMDETYPEVPVFTPGRCGHDW
jgi:anti-sigma factor RsiW